MASGDSRRQERRGTDAKRRAATPWDGEIIVTTDSDHLGGFQTTGDGTTPGGVYPGAGNAQPGWRSGSWYYTQNSLLAPVTASVSKDILSWMPICVPAGEMVTFQNIGINVIGGGAAGAKARVGIYGDDGNKPGALVYDSGDLTITTAGFKSVFGSFSAALRPGWYWVAFVTNDSTATFSSLSSTGYGSTIGWQSSGTLHPSLWWKLHTYGALPTTANPTGVSTGVAPLVHIQAA